MSLLQKKIKNISIANDCEICENSCVKLTTKHGLLGMHINKRNIREKIKLTAATFKEQIKIELKNKLVSVTQLKWMPLQDTAGV